MSAVAPTTAPQRKSSRPTPDQRAAFYSALERGLSINKAAQLAGIAKNTGTHWARDAKVRKAEQLARSAAIASKTDVVAELTRLGLSDPEVAPRDKVAALVAVNKAMGYEAPTRSESVVIHATVSQYLEIQRQRLMPKREEQQPAAAAATIEAGGGSPK